VKFELALSVVPRSGPFAPALKVPSPCPLPAGEGQVVPTKDCHNRGEVPSTPYHVGGFALNCYSTKPSSTRISINSCNLDNLLLFVKNAFAPKERLAATYNASGGATLYFARNWAAARATLRLTSTMDRFGK